MTEPDQVILRATTRARINLPDALTWAAIDGIGLLTSPAHFHVTIASGVGCVTDRGPVRLSDVYEARVFNTEAELRWWCDYAGEGHAVVLSEDAERLPDGGTLAQQIETIAVLDGGYLLWGTAVHSGPPPWVTLATARIGGLQVPLLGHGNSSALIPTPVPARTPAPMSGSASDATGYRVRLAVKEYVAAEPVHGNTYVAEERLLDLVRVPPQGGAR